MHVPILAEKLITRGHSVQVLAHPEGSILTEVKSRSIPADPISLGAYFNPRATRSLIRLIRKYKPDIVHLHLSRDLWQVVPAVRIAGGGPKIILTKHVGSYVKKKDPLHTWLYRHVSRIITVSEVLHKNVIDTCPIPSEKVVTIHHALDMSKYNPQVYDSAQIRRELDIKAEEFVIGTVGRISPGKGLEDFIDAAGILNEKLPELGLLFLIVGTASYGEDVYFNEMKQKVEAAGLNRVIRFVGFRDDVPALLNIMDLFIFPSRAEGFGATLIEAMAMGTASVSTYGDGTLDTISDEKTGLTYAPGDIDGLIGAATRVITDHSLRERLGASGRRFVIDHFDLNVMTERVEQVYDEALGIQV